MCYSNVQTVQSENTDGLVLASEWNYRVFEKTRLVMALFGYCSFLCRISAAFLGYRLSWFVFLF